MHRVVDLSLTFKPGLRGYHFDVTATVAEQGWNARTLHLYSHAGTHMDAQVHFDSGPTTIDQIPIEHCVTTAHVVDLWDVPPRTLLTPDHLGSVAQSHQSGESILLKTGWSRHVDSPQYYRDEFPRVGEELAQWCVDHDVRILGVEPPSVADVNNMEEVTRIHHILLGGQILIVEGLANLDKLQSKKVTFIAAPLKIEGGDGCPVRAFALDPTTDVP